jgi:hypothetical protein
VQNLERFSLKMVTSTVRHQPMLRKPESRCFRSRAASGVRASGRLEWCPRFPADSTNNGNFLAKNSIFLMFFDWKGTSKSVNQTGLDHSDSYLEAFIILAIYRPWRHVTHLCKQGLLRRKAVDFHLAGIFYIPSFTALHKQAKHPSYPAIPSLPCFQTIVMLNSLFLLTNSCFTLR